MIYILASRKQEILHKIIYTEGNEEQEVMRENNKMKPKKRI